MSTCPTRVPARHPLCCPSPPAPPLSAVSVLVPPGIVVPCISTIQTPMSRISIQTPMSRICEKCGGH
eukprot:923928-Pleurochrysis_carterae.AAC.1